MWHRLVRDQAFKAMNMFVGRLTNMVESMVSSGSRSRFLR